MNRNIESSADIDDDRSLAPNLTKSQMINVQLKLSNKNISAQYNFSTSYSKSTFISNQKAPSQTDIIQGASRDKITRIQTGLNPTSISVNVHANKIYVTNSASDTVSIINGSTNKLITNIETGKTPIASTIDSLTNKVYVANYGDDSITVINGSSNKILSRYSLGFTPVALAVNPSSNHLFIVDSISGLISIDLSELK